MTYYSIHWRQFLLLLLSPLMLQACGGKPPGGGPPPVAVEMDRVETTQVKQSTEYVARVEGVDNSVIQPRVSGWVKQVYVKLGDRVAAGDPLILIDPAQQQANYESQLAVVESRRADLQRAEAELKAQEAELRRIQAELEFQSQAAAQQQAQQDYEAEIQEKERLAFEVENAKENLEAANEELKRRQAILKEREASFKRYESLKEEGVISAELYDQKLRDQETSEAEVANQEKEVRAAQARVQSAQKELDRQDRTIQSAEANIDSAGQDLARQISTLDAQIESQKSSIEAQKAQIALIERDIESAQAQAVAQQVELDYYNINAPIAGIVGEVPVKVGDLVNSQTTVTSIRQNDQLEVNINVPVDRLSQLRVGTPVELLNQETGELIGTSRVSFISPSAGTGTQTILVKAIYTNRNNQLRTDQIVRARVIWDQEAGVTVPTTAISRIGDQSFVFVVQEDISGDEPTWVAKQQPVELGSLQGQSYQVISGVNAGDRIVTEGVVKLRDGTPVMDQSEQPQEAVSPTETTSETPSDS
jgi:RND family efflux transporter MFP subunit